jgi:hypothetical protein
MSCQGERAHRIQQEGLCGDEDTDRAERPRHPTSRPAGPQGGQALQSAQLGDRPCPGCPPGVEPRL